MRGDQAPEVFVAVVRTIEAPVSAVYEAWRNPELLTEWFAAGADFVTDVSVDFKCGGHYRIEGHHADGSGSYSITGTYIDLAEDRRIAMSWHYDGPAASLKSGKSVVIAQLRYLEPNLTELTITHEKRESSEGAEIIEGAWQSCLSKLHSIVKAESAIKDQTLGGNQMTRAFNDQNITWYSLDWLPDLEFYVYKVDAENKIIDILFKFAKNSKVRLHRHKAPYITFVIQGELRFYRPNGELKEIRPTGSYVSGVANAEPHWEGGGDEDAIVFFSNRNVEGPLYEFLDENMQPTVTLGFQDFKDQLEKQGNPKWQSAA